MNLSEDEIIQKMVQIVHIVTKILLFHKNMNLDLFHVVITKENEKRTLKFNENEQISLVD